MPFSPQSSPRVAAALTPPLSPLLGVALPVAPSGRPSASPSGAALGARPLLASSYTSPRLAPRRLSQSSPLSPAMLRHPSSPNLWAGRDASPFRVPVGRSPATSAQGTPSRRGRGSPASSSPASSRASSAVRPARQARLEASPLARPPSRARAESPTPAPRRRPRYFAPSQQLAQLMSSLAAADLACGRPTAACPGQGSLAPSPLLALPQAMPVPAPLWTARLLDLVAAARAATAGLRALPLWQPGERIETADGPREYAPHAADVVQMVPLEGLFCLQNMQVGIQLPKVETVLRTLAEGHKVRPIEVDPMGCIDDGNHRYFVSQLLELPEIGVIRR